MRTASSTRRLRRHSRARDRVGSEPRAAHHRRLRRHRIFPPLRIAISGRACARLDQTGAVHCWTFGPQEVLDPYDRAMTVHFVETESDTDVLSEHEIALERMIELVTAVRTHVKGRGIARIDYTPVHGGGAWSATEFGYEAGFASQSDSLPPPHRIVQRCDERGMCTWKVIQPAGLVVTTSD